VDTTRGTDVRVGASLPTLTRVPLAELVLAAVEAERIGCTTAWVPESWCRDPFGALHAIGAATTRLRLGTGVAVLASRTPTATAMAAQTLAEACPGRVALGLGSGHAETVEGWLGVAHAASLANLEEYVAVIRQVWSGEPLRPAGRSWHVADFASAAPRLSPTPRLLLAALGPRAQALAARIADGAIMTMATVQAVADAAPLLAGKELVASFLAGLDESDRPAARASIAGYAFWAQYRRHLGRLGYADAAARLGAAWAQVGRTAWAAGVRPPAVLELVPDMLVDQMAAIGVGEIRRRIDAYAAAGATEVVVRPLIRGGRVAQSVVEVLAALTAPSPLHG
jgi:alkanesulfonate monooxygenase SsuD/methylene tetrahydromethanopterin reductase-like flavin-dependent oxidoreductase (luciferase family)